MKYQEPAQVDAEREGIAVIMRGANIELICETLLGLAIHEPDWRWVQELCLEATNHADRAVRAISATSLGHLARIHRTLDLERVLPRLDALLADPATSGYAETALDDVRQFVTERDG